jgi:osmotically-inducible protein OsmY
MGLVKREEGDAAAEVAAKTSGVGKVVKVFEYID